MCTVGVLSFVLLVKDNSQDNLFLHNLFRQEYRFTACNVLMKFLKFTCFSTLRFSM